MPIKETDTVVRTDNDSRAKMRDGEVILNFDNRVNYGLGDFGTRIWELLDEPCDVDELVEIIASEFDMNRGAARIDVLQFIGDLAREDLVELRD